jgi:predicted dehydrogenase
MLKVGIIGAGGIGRVHASVYQGMPNVKLIAISDIRNEAASSVADEFKIKAFNSADELIDLSEVDIIDVCTPTPIHKEYVIKAAMAGKHVICEKPIARNLDEAQDMVRICKKAGVKFMVAHVVRFFPEYAKIRELIEQGSAGKPAVVRASRSVGVVAGWNNWYSNYELSGGLMLELMIHDFDVLRWYFGDVKRVFATEARQNGTEYALATLRFENGVIAHVEGSRAHFLSFKSALEIAGDGGLIDFDSNAAKPINLCIGKKGDSDKEIAIPSSPTEESPYYKELFSFVNCVEKDLDPPINGVDATKSLKVALAALESAKTGKVVRL